MHLERSKHEENEKLTKNKVGKSQRKRSVWRHRNYNIKMNLE